ncbi:hypothetical protein JCM33374_g830 [Metschnikowia sp. JCM 33374]|nr:hypothetical protein JCM33374_g830 [Metschnikowia sp. JCM 33374]
MSDSEYSMSSSKIRSGAVSQQRNDEVLNDHRNQRETLPPPEDNLALPCCDTKGGAEAPVRRHSRSHSFCDPLEDPRGFSRRKSRTNRNDLPRIIKTTTNGSHPSVDNNARGFYAKRERRPSRSSVDSEADSHASRSSQETEEDVCFPMLREHVRINGIDFDEIEDFINEERENQLYVKEQGSAIVERLSPNAHMRGSVSVSVNEKSQNAQKYSPKNILMKTRSAFSGKQRGSVVEDPSNYFTRKGSDSSGDVFVDEKTDDISSDNVRFGGTKINNGELELPDRFSFFHSDNEETVHSPDIPSLVSSGTSVRELFKNGEGTWWLDCTCPTDAEMKTLAKAFGIHPLTAEDIRMQESREKVELFKNYYFLCFHTFEPDKESEDYLEPIHMYIVVFREGVLTFHFSPVSHPANVRRRVRQLRDYVDVSADWIGYAMIDDITDGFAPVITGIEYEADAIEDSVFEALTVNFSSMLRRIGESRRKVMTLMRLLSNKADVIRMFAKRCQDEVWTVPTNPVTSRVNLAGMAAQAGTNTASPAVSGMNFGPPPGAPSSMMSQYHPPSGRVQPRADIALYLGDIQDHVVTMFQNLSAYEKIFSRSHANYLAQLQVESFNSNLTVTKILGNVTMIGTMFLPMNVITGLFGMNVHVPGEQEDIWFWGILAFMVLLSVASWLGVKFYLRKLEAKEVDREDTKRSIKSYSLRNKKKEAAKSILSFPNRYD